jgi:rRNA-processing protein FCF1
MAFDRIWGDKIRKTVILDTSALLSFFEFSIDWETELDRILGSYSVVVPAAVVSELRMLQQKKKTQKKASAALHLISKYTMIDDAAVTADDACLNIAEKTNGIVMTNDSGLRERLQKHGHPVLFLRGKKRLVLDE